MIVDLLLEKRSWNELKISVLELLKNNPKLTSHDISATMATGVPSAGMILLNLHRQGLVDRKRPGLWRIFRKPPYEYSINDRGLRRLNYLSQKRFSRGVENTKQGD